MEERFGREGEIGRRDEGGGKGLYIGNTLHAASYVSMT